jgi:hypothetical protein
MVGEAVLDVALTSSQQFRRSWHIMEFLRPIKNGKQDED